MFDRGPQGGNDTPISHPEFSLLFLVRDVFHNWGQRADAEQSCRAVWEHTVEKRRGVDEISSSGGCPGKEHCWVKVKVPP